ncbi:MAG: toast rack family protein [Candidatus Acidiferrales bacterium]
MGSGRPYRRRSLTGAFILIAIGALFLYSNLRPDFDPWSVMSRFWPLLLIFWGLGRIIDYFVFRNATDESKGAGFSGEALAVLILFVLFFIALSHSHSHRAMTHEQKSVDKQGASSVNISVEMPAGELRISGGAPATKLLEADFNYREWDGKPEVNYSSSGTQGTLNIEQVEGHHIHWGTSNNKWDLHLNNDVPSDLNIHMGAGKSDLRLQGLNLSHVDLEMGAGQLNADLNGDWKKDLDVNLQGGVGSATIHLPKNVGVQVHASGGIGSVSTQGLKEEGDDYVNDAYRKSPVTVHVSIHGGIGHIRLETGP